MVKLNKFYDLISRNATVTLTNSRLDKTYYEGSARSIPAEYDDCTVEDFCMSNEGDLLFKIKVKEKAPADPHWQEGALRVYDENYHYWVKVYETGSKYGIDGGRVSKLTIKRGGETVANYDRGWDIEPVDEGAKLAMEIILHQYA
jgi:hypothetical protein